MFNVHQSKQLLDTVIESPVKSYVLPINNNHTMKYHTLSTSTIAASEGKKSSFTIYADIMDFKHEKLEAELLSARRELEGVQTALHQQTQRCRELVTEFSKKLQSKEIQIHSERQLRDQQLTKVLRALLLFEARLVREQKHIRQQLQEKDTIIYNQQLQIKKLQEPPPATTITLRQQCCKNNNSPQSSSSTQESSLSSLETTHNDYNNWSHCAILLPPTILDSSSSDVYASISENDYKNTDQQSVSSEDTNCIRRFNTSNFERKNSFIKNKLNSTKNDLKRMKKYSSNRLKKDTANSSSPTVTYYDVIKRVNRNDLADSSSNDDEIKEKTLSDNINDVSKRIENVFEETQDTLRLSQSYSERIENLHGIKRVEHNRNGSVTDELYTSSSFSGDSSTTTSTNYCSTGDIRGSYEPNGNFNCYSSTKSDSEMTTTSKNNIDDGFAEGDIEIFELNDDEPENLSKDNNILFVFDNNKTPIEETENNWYAYASDQEDDQKCDIYKDNPVLECMNQILLQNINDSIHSPPKSPIPTSTNTTLTKSKSPKRVKFLDDGVNGGDTISSSDKDDISNKNSQDDYYETPIQNVANVYEVPQSIYSNDYEQILINRNDHATTATTKWSKSENLQEKEINRMSSQKLYVIKNIELNDNDNDYYYVDMDTKSDSTATSPTAAEQSPSIRKYPRTPPALPPKPANLVSKYKIHGKPLTAENLSIMNSKNIEQRGEEPDYCSISELNMAAIENHHHPIVNTSSNIVEISDVQNVSSLYDQIIGNAPNLVSKCSTPLVRSEKSSTPSPRQQSSSEKKKNEPEIPKLPQVSEIIIPSESSDTESKDGGNISVTHDNYIKNNSQLFKKKNEQKYKTPIVMGTSVSSLITGFNKQHIMAELNNKVLSTSPINNSSNLKKSPRKSCSNLFTNFDLNQNCDKQMDSHQISKSTSDIPLSFEKFDLSQNFEEFNLDDCEITEEYRIDDLCNDNELSPAPSPKRNLSPKRSSPLSPNVKKSIKYNNSEVKSTTAAIIPTQQTTVLPIQQNNNNKNKNTINVPKTNKNSVIPHQTLLTYENQQPNYEHFLECTGLSSKSILTPSRLLSNHKSMLKPKDVKLRNKVKTYATVEKQQQNGNTIKYYSEPYL